MSHQTSKRTFLIAQDLPCLLPAALVLVSKVGFPFNFFRLNMLLVRVGNTAQEMMLG